MNFKLFEKDEQHHRHFTIIRVSRIMIISKCATKFDFSFSRKCGRGVKTTHIRHDTRGAFYFCFYFYFLFGLTLTFLVPTYIKTSLIINNNMQYYAIIIKTIKNPCIDNQIPKAFVIYVKLFFKTCFYSFIQLLYINIILIILWQKRLQH